MAKVGQYLFLLITLYMFTGAKSFYCEEVSEEEIQRIRESAYIGPVSAEDGCKVTCHQVCCSSIKQVLGQLLIPIPPGCQCSCRAN